MLIRQDNVLGACFPVFFSARYVLCATSESNIKSLTLVNNIFETVQRSVKQITLTFIVLANVTMNGTFKI